MRIPRTRRRAIGAAALVVCHVLCFRALAMERVPFVGCPSDGQSGPVAAPKGEAKAINADAATASQLAYYQAQDSFGALAPRGWRCFYLYGSNGASLLIAPSGNLDAPDVRLRGPAIIATVSNGGTSGRFAVAKYAARLFPKLAQDFIAGVVAEGIEPKESFPAGPYSADKLTYKSARRVEFITPANKDGLGASDRLLKNSTSIVGMATLKETPDGPDFFLLTVRLPPAQANLATTIVAQAE
jgi:hypothetical protein